MDSSIIPIPPATETRELRAEGEALIMDFGRGHHVSIATAFNSDLARRLAVCWNKFVPMPTSMIETMPGGVVQLAKMARENIAQNFQGWAIMHADGKRWRTLDSIGMPDRTEDPSKALVMRLKEHVERYAEDDSEDIRIVPAPEVSS